MPLINPLADADGTWIRGSFHGHCSENSACSSVPLALSVGQYAALGVGFVTLTDHDIVTDLAAVLNGGMGVSPSSNINPSDRTRPPMFEPTHGSAPDIAGKNVAGPTAMLLTTAMMLEWMGVEDPAADRAGKRLREVVAADLAEHGRERRATDEIGDAIVNAL